MKKIFLICALSFVQNAMANSIPMSAQLTLPTMDTDIHIVDAEYVLMATKTETHQVPGCNVDSRTEPVCQQTVTVESAPAIRVNISYIDPMMSEDGMRYQFTSMILPLSDFSADEVAALKAVYPTWKHPFQSVGHDFAKAHLALNVTKVAEGTRMVDPSKSTLCSPYEENHQSPRMCTEKLVYRTVDSPVLVLHVSHQ